MYKPFPEIPKKKKKLRKPKSNQREKESEVYCEIFFFNGVYNLKPGFQHRRRRVEVNEAQKNRDARSGIRSKTRDDQMEIRIRAKLVKALCQVRRNSSSSPSLAKLSSSSSVGRHRKIRDATKRVLAILAPQPHTIHAELKPPSLV